MSGVEVAMEKERRKKRERIVNFIIDLLNSKSKNNHS
jgi:hypothetical protein